MKAIFLGHEANWPSLRQFTIGKVYVFTFTPNPPRLKGIDVYEVDDDNGENAQYRTDVFEKAFLKIPDGITDKELFKLGLQHGIQIQR